MKIWKITIFALCSILFIGGCGKEKNLYMPKEGEMSLVEWKNELPRQSIFQQMDTENVMDNSNFLNMGYMAVDHEKERLYFTDLETDAIYSAHFDGSDKTKLCDFPGIYIQVYQSKIYFLNERNFRLMRVDSDKNIQYLTEQSIGEYVIIDNKIYAFGDEGFLCMDLEGNLLNEPYRGICQLANFQVIGTDILANVICGEDTTLFFQGNLLVYHTTDDSFSYVRDKAIYPLYYDNQLSIWNTESGSRQNNGLSDKGALELNIYEQRPVSDGSHLYYVDYSGGESCLWEYDGKTAKILCCLGEYGFPEYKYIADGYIYLLMRENDTSIYRWCVYDLENAAWKEW